MWIAAQHRVDRLHIWIHEQGSLQSASVDLAVGAPFQETLLTLIDPYLPPDAVTPVICAGAQAGSFAQVPCAVPPLQKSSCADPRVSLQVLPCLSQAHPVDMMQGEEAVILGFLAETPEWDGVLCIAGRCTRWVHISAGEVVSFRSYLSGEMFELLTQQSSLSGAVQGQGADNAAFEEAMSDAMSRPERFASALFGVHANAVLQRTAAATGRAQILGGLIGIELAATRPYWLGRDVALIGEGAWMDHYATALKAQGVSAQIHDVNRLALLGLTTAYAQLDADR